MTFHANLAINMYYFNENFKQIDEVKLEERINKCR